MPIVVNPRSYPIVEVIDPSGKRGIFCIWAAISPGYEAIDDIGSRMQCDYVTIVHARQIPENAFSFMAKDIRRERHYLPHEPELAIMDQRGGAASLTQETEDTWFDGFRKCGLFYQKSTQTADVRPADAAVLHDWLRPNWNPVLQKFIPRLTFTASVARIKEGPLWAVKSFLWDAEKSRAWHYKQTAKDYVDCLRYLVTYPGLTYKRLAVVRGAPASVPSLASTYRTPMPSDATRQQRFIGLRRLAGSSYPRGSY